jgi:hypothetical protein
MKHKPGCDNTAVNPITEWMGGNKVVIVGYECPKCHAKEIRGTGKDGIDST